MCRIVCCCQNLCAILWKSSSSLSSLQSKRNLFKEKNGEWGQVCGIGVMWTFSMIDNPTPSGPRFNQCLQWGLYKLSFLRTKQLWELSLDKKKCKCVSSHACQYSSNDWGHSKSYSRQYVTLKRFFRHFLVCSLNFVFGTVLQATLPTIFPAMVTKPLSKTAVLITIDKIHPQTVVYHVFLF